MKNLILPIFLMISFSLLTSCNKRDPNPELQDEIYKDLRVELDIAKKALEQEEKGLVELKKELDLAIPQTGQIKFATKKVRSAEDSINTLRQQKIYFEIKLEQRKNYVQQRYEESFSKGGRPWPDQKEIEAYKMVTRLNREKLTYDKNKRMVKESVPRGTK